jgi:hypothetical protein
MGIGAGVVVGVGMGVGAEGRYLTLILGRETKTGERSGGRLVGGLPYLVNWYPWHPCVVGYALRTLRPGILGNRAHSRPAGRWLNVGEPR